MSKSLKEASVLDILPQNLRQDPDIIAASKALDTGTTVLFENIQALVMVPKVADQPDDILDHLAYYFHVDFYSRSMNRQTKIELIEDSIYRQQIKGTPLSVEILIETLFEEGEVEEWYQYGGDPGTFRVVTPNASVTQDRALEFIRALNSVKRLSAHLDTVVILQRESLDLFFGAVNHEGSFETHEQVGDV